MRNVCGQFCGIFVFFFSQLLGQSCTIAVCPRSFLCAWLPEIALLRACRADDFGWFGHGVHFSRFFPHFFRGGSNMVAFRAEVDGTLAKFQRRLRVSKKFTKLGPSNKRVLIL